MTVALITGANRGIGLETARQLVIKGIHVILGVREVVKGNVAAEALRREGYKAEAIELDIVNPEHHQAALAYIENKFGVLDVLVNNAGRVAQEEYDTKVSTVPIAAVREVFETNFFSTVALTQALLPLIRKSSAGRIVNLSSRLGSLSANANAAEGGWYDQLGYNASKAALNMFTVLLARELRDTPIKVNSAHPGWVQTDMGGPSAPMQVEDGAKTSVWLATLPPNGPTGGYFHMQQPLEW